MSYSGQSFYYAHGISARARKAKWFEHYPLRVAVGAWFDQLDAEGHADRDLTEYLISHEYLTDNARRWIR